jgi:hypothetical protein
VTQAHAAACAEPVCELRDAQVKLRGVEDGVFAIVSVLIVPRLNLLPDRAGRLGCIRGIDDAGRCRQVVEQRARAVEKERQIVLDATWSHAAAHVPVYEGAARITLKPFAVALPERLDGLGVERNLARGQQAHALKMRARALRFRIEHANGFDLLIEEVDAQRFRRTHGKHVDDGTAHGAFAGSHHLGNLRIARLREALAKRLARQAIAFREQQRVRFDETRRG